MKKSKTIGALLLAAASVQPLAAQTATTLKGNTGNTYNQNYSSNGSLTIDLGVFAEYLVVGGGGGGGASSG